jgi:hypothetical protein
MNSKDVELIFNILKQLQPSISESIQFYNKEYEHRFGHVVQFKSKNKIIAIWLDLPSLNAPKLKILFTRHKEVNHNFFIQEIDDFYRVGWKLK